MHHWNSVAVWSPREEDVIWAWNKVDTSQFESSSSLGANNGIQTGSFTIEAVTSPYHSDQQKDYLLKLSFTQSAGGVVWNIPVTQSRYVVNIEFYSSSFFTTFFINDKRFLVGPSDQTSRDGVFVSSLAQSSGRGIVYHTSGSSSLRSRNNVSGLTLGSDEIWTIFINKKPDSTSPDFKITEKVQDNQFITTTHTSLSYSVPSSWSGSSFDNLSFGVLVTSSFQAHGVMYIKDIIITKHPFDIT